jgi:hypothetical protein
MTNALTTTASAPDVQAIEQLLIAGDLARLTPTQRVSYYKAVCDSLGLNPLTRPFDYITLNGKLTLYAKRDCTDQLRKIHGVSITKLERELTEDIYTVTAYAQDVNGRTDTALGAISLGGLKGEARANAVMKCETKAKRRVTLSICGLGMTDETETESIPNARPVAVDTATGEIVAEVALPEGFASWADDMTAVADQGTEKFREAWRMSAPAYRKASSETLRNSWKDRAKAADAREAHRAA